MKNLSLYPGVWLFLGVLLSVNSFSQNDSTLQYIDWKNSKAEYQAGFSANFHQAYSNLKPGFFFEAVIDDRFHIGVYGQMTTGNFAYQYPDYQNNILTQDVGVSIGFSQDNNKKIHVGTGVKIGYITMQADSTKEVSAFESFTPTSKDNGIIFYPEINATVNLSKHLRYRMGTGYNVLMLSDETVVPNKSLDTWFFVMSLIYCFNNH